MEGNVREPVSTDAWVDIHVLTHRTEIFETPLNGSELIT